MAISKEQILDYIASSGNILELSTLIQEFEEKFDVKPIYMDSVKLINLNDKKEIKKKKPFYRILENKKLGKKQWKK